MPEIATMIDRNVELIPLDERHESSHARRVASRLEDNYAWRNATHRRCAQECLWSGAGSVFLQPLSFLGPGAEEQWPLRSIAKSQVCDVESAEDGVSC